MTRPERSRQERRIARGREADAAFERIYAEVIARVRTCACPPCPGRGDDGHRMAQCAECCFGSGVEADIDCPVHGASAERA